MFRIVIPMLCRSKKNSQEMILNPRTKKPMIIQSKLYRDFEKNCGYFLKKYAKKIDYPVNLNCKFFVPDRRRRDLTNLENALGDILVKYNVLVDDNYTVLAGWDGSRIIYEKGREEIIVDIEELKEESENDYCCKS